MKYVTFMSDDGPVVGLLSDDGQSVHPLDLEPGAARIGVLAVIDRMLAGHSVGTRGEAVLTGKVRPLAPIPRPRRNIFCVGKNYFEHAREFAGSGFDSSVDTESSGSAVPDVPIIFSKVPESVIAFGDGIPIDATVSEAIDYEGELAVIIGRGGRKIAKDEALDHVWGYTIINDVTARDIQGRHKQWLLGKSQDGFCPMGPVAVTADEVDLEHGQLRCWVNGELRQHASLGQLIFDIPTLIATISAGITLLPGDIIATGTPAGVGIGFRPPKYLHPGDSVRIEIDGIGVLENPAVAANQGAAA
jgi:2-keto-4-pentenoate hydratase/2-oxohepta-3-ene-1,7-dioic acid hydratase in catechol pathway